MRGICCHKAQATPVQRLPCTTMWYIARRCCACTLRRVRGSSVACGIHFGPWTLWVQRLPSSLLQVTGAKVPLPILCDVSCSVRFSVGLFLLFKVFLLFQSSLYRGGFRKWLRCDRVMQKWSSERGQLSLVSAAGTAFLWWQFPSASKAYCGGQSTATIIFF